MNELEQAWKLREFLEGTDPARWPALRIFHGPGEGSRALARIAIDRFGTHAWVTCWDEASPAALSEISEFLRGKRLDSAVVLERPRQGVPEEPRVLFGKPPEGRFLAHEGPAKFTIQLLGARHPGLFLDHAPLRRWLHSHARGFDRALNTFAYTGSLSVACGLGGARHVTTLDLAKPVVQWAQENWETNGLPLDRARFIAGDVFEWLPRLKREGERFDCVILDPPSSSQSKKTGRFSTQKDLSHLHALAMDLVAPEGLLITSINSANIAWAKYESDVFTSAREKKQQYRVIARIDQPSTFPSPLGVPEERYLKGFILKRSG